MILAEVVIISPNVFNLQSLKSCMSPHLGPRFLRKCFLTFQSMMPDVWLTQIGMTIICAVVVLRGTQVTLGSRHSGHKGPTGPSSGEKAVGARRLRGSEDPRSFWWRRRNNFYLKDRKLD